MGTVNSTPRSNVYNEEYDSEESFRFEINVKNDEKILNYKKTRCIEGNINAASSSKGPDEKNVLKFHHIHGKNLTISKNSHLAERSESSFCDAIAFSNRPVEIYERVYIKIIKLSSIWNGMVRFGFTTINPNSMIKTSIYEETDNRVLNEQENSFDLPKYVYPDLTNKKGYWAAAIPEGSLRENDILYFYVNSNGEIHYGINEKYIGQFLDGVNVYNIKPKQAQPLWAIFDVYGNTLSIELDSIDALKKMSPYDEKPKVPAFTTRSVDNSRLSSLGSSIDHLSCSPSNSIQTSINQSLDTTNSSTTSSLQSITTVIPNNKFRMININQDENQGTDDYQLDRLLISCRRLCVDNHLNETLHNSIIIDNNNNNNIAINNPNPEMNEPVQSLRNKTLCNKLIDLNKSIKEFYSTIPILIHDVNLASNEINTFLSKVHGKNVKISQPDCLIAFRESSITALQNKYYSTVLNPKRFQIKNNQSNDGSNVNKNCYVFIEKPIENGKYYCLQIVGMDQNDSSSGENESLLTIGCTSCKPSLLNPLIDLPNDANELLDRPEYWIVCKNVFDSSNLTFSLADELCFRIDESNGNLNFYINGNLKTECLFNVDQTQQLWFFFDMSGRANAIRLIPSCQSNNSLPANNSNGVVMRSTLNPCLNDRTYSSRRRRPNSALMEYYKMQFQAAPQSSNDALQSKAKGPSDKKQNYYQEECRICWDAPIECVFYSCGHMCLCWNCATTLKKESLSKPTNGSNSQAKTTKNPLCPICRLEIIDIIRFFKT